MPCNIDFSLSVVVGGVFQPEYERRGVHYVESKLDTPHSFLQRSTCIVNGEDESQDYAVTPYEICITASPAAPACYYRVYVDGHKVKSLSLKPGEQKRVKGFRDGDEIKQFLFSLPRLPEHAGDRLCSGQESQVGVIRVECRDGVLLRTGKTVRTKDLSFRQANKKDGVQVTGGEYTMMTTKVGRKVSASRRLKDTDFWRVGNLRSELSVKYVTGQTLRDMGVSVQPVDWSAGHGQPVATAASTSVPSLIPVPGFPNPQPAVSLPSSQGQPADFSSVRVKQEAMGAAQGTNLDIKVEDDDVVFSGRDAPRGRVKVEPKDSGVLIVID